MEFMAEIKCRIQITARDLPEARQVLKEKHGCLVGGGTTAEAKEYFIRELRDHRTVLSGPTAMKKSEIPKHADKDKILHAEKVGVMHIHGVDVPMTSYKPGDKVTSDHGDLVCISSITEEVKPIQLDLPEMPKPVVTELKPKFKRKSL